MYCSAAFPHRLIDVFSFVKLGVKPLQFGKSNRSFIVIKGFQRHCLRGFSSSENERSLHENEDSKQLDAELKKRIFNTVLWEQDEDVSFVRRKRNEKKAVNHRVAQTVLQGVERVKPLSLKLLDDNADVDCSPSKPPEVIEVNPPTYPFAKAVQRGIEHENELNVAVSGRDHQDRRQLSQTLEHRKRRMRQWMSDYDLFDENPEVSIEASNTVNYGSSNPDEPVSQVPCGGCGALLHCKDHSIPGYLPKELFAKRSVKELKSMICQRCHFLKEFNVALDVNVTPEEYPKIISCIRNTRAIVVLMVDLLDFPCTIWPGVMDIIGSKRPVIIVGNKVDLIPGDHLGYLKHIKQTLQIYVEKMGVAKANIKHVALISAYTGFGVEDLITQLHDLWKYKSDMYLVGCTNVGKSSLFNKLLQSDFCKTKAVDLVPRATTSIWPGTTLNLLKFPILRPEGWKLALRRKRLMSDATVRQQEKKLRKEQCEANRLYHMPSFMQFVGRSFIVSKAEKQNDMYAIGNAKSTQIGIDEEDEDFAKGRWCFDTPGVMHPDQILNILTTEELTKVIPRTPIVPRFFLLKPGRSLFLAGLGRIDLLSSTKDQSSRVAVFSSNHLPITIVQTHEADNVYKKLLGSELMAVPCGDSQRLADWQGLKAIDEPITVKGLGWRECCADIVLSSTGWVAISGGQSMEMSFRIWTPFARGIHLRQPALVPYSVNFRGKRFDHTPTYKTGRADGKPITPMEKVEEEDL